MTISRTFEWDMGHRIPSHNSLCKNPHGHRYKISIGIGGELNKIANDSQEGMVLDFSRFKEIINSQIIDKLDHSFMYWGEDKVMKEFASENPSFRMVQVDFVPTVELITQHLAEQIITICAHYLPNIHLERIDLYETPNCKATWTRP